MRISDWRSDVCSSVLDIAFTEAGLVNNVDVAGDIIVASDRNDGVNAHLALFRLDASKPAIVPPGRAAAGAGEAYGLRLKKTAPGQPITAALTVKDGTVRVGQLALGAGAAQIGRAAGKDR